LAAISFELCDCASVLLEEIARPESTRKDVAITYSLALRSSEPVDWAAVNRAILGRWEKSSLIWIKDRAWKLAEGKPVRWR
jgi:hypothetical protein